MNTITYIMYNSKGKDCGGGGRYRDGPERRIVVICAAKWPQFWLHISRRMRKSTILDKI
jgi:hypothetical protein